MIGTPPFPTPSGGGGNQFVRPVEIRWTDLSILRTFRREELEFYDPGPLIGPIGYGVCVCGALTIHRNALLDIDGLLKMVWVNKPPWEGLVRGGFHLEFQWFIGI